jgi:glycosyltransferase involved in cell wall biosynthesis
MRCVNPAHSPRSQALLISLVVPCFNEQYALLPFVTRLHSLAERLDQEFAARLELIFVDDGSSDGTRTTARSIIQSANTPFAIRLLALSRNFGKEIALTAGIRAASGDAVVPIDVDLQDPPELVCEMVHAWLATDDVDVVEAVRADRRCESVFKRASAAAFYSIIRKIAQDVPLTANCGDFQLLSRRAVDALLRYPERTRLHKGLTALIGFRRATVRYTRAARSVGSSRYGLVRLVGLAWEGITSLSTTPLRVWTWIGSAIALVALTLALWTVVRTLVMGVAVPGYASLLVAVLGLGGVQLIGLGVLGEYVGRIATETRGRPLYHVAERVGFDDRARVRERQPSGCDDDSCHVRTESQSW